MAQKLSELHKDILKAAHVNHDRKLKGGDDSGGMDLYDHEALHAVFGLPYRKKGWFKELPDPRTEPGGEFFSMKDIGENRYKTCKRTAWKAFAELEDLGLCVRFMGSDPDWVGINLTPKGVQAAKELQTRPDVDDLLGL